MPKHMIRKGQMRWLAKGDVLDQRAFIHSVHSLSAWHWHLRAFIIHKTRSTGRHLLRQILMREWNFAAA
jgi:hypothetical protein